MTRARLKDQVENFKQEEIIRVAGDLFYHKGFTKTSVDDIATALSIGKPMIYTYFSSKVDLLAAVCNRVTALAADLAMYSSQTEGTATEKLEKILHDLCLRTIEGRTYLAVLFREVKHLPPYGLEQLSQNDQAFRAIIVQLLEEGKRNGEFSYSTDEKVMAHAISGMTTWIHTWFRESGPLSPEQVAAQMIDMVWKMVGRETAL